jgi:hypothetical protein
MNHSTTGLTEKCLHPVTRSSIMLPGVEDDSVWVPPDFLFKHTVTAILNQQEHERERKNIIVHTNV